MKKSTTRTAIAVVCKSITANRKKIEAAAIEYQAYFCAYNTREAKRLLDIYKTMQTDAKTAGDAVTESSARKLRLQIEDALGRAKRIKLTAEERAAVQSLVDRGLTFADISEAYLAEHLAGTEWMDATGNIVKKATKSQLTKGSAEYVPVTNWTPATFATYLRRAFVEATAIAKSSIR